MSDRSDLLRVANRVVWFKQPEDAIKDVTLFLAHVMTYGTLTDIATTLRYSLRTTSSPSSWTRLLEYSTAVRGHIGT